MILRPKTWPETVQFLCAEQQLLERHPTLHGGFDVEAGAIDLLCQQYAAKHAWPTTLTEHDQKAILQRFSWARTVAAMMLQSFRKADGTDTGWIQYPDWEFETMMVWFLVEIWRTAEKLPSLLQKPLPPRTKPEWPPGSDLN